MRYRLLTFALFFSMRAFSQTADSSSTPVDSTTLQNVTVKAFESKTKWKDVPASVSVLNKKDLQRFDVSNMVAEFNAATGVRMEERSPGSYRLSVRGSLLRSPFGVRDIKIYLDDVPFTDATGNTYLNLIDPNHLQSVEIIKGPSSSIYGANTGGVVLLNSLNDIGNAKNKFDASLAGGSYGMFSEEAGWQTQHKKFFSSLQQSHMQSDGYRQQSAMRKDVIKWNGKAALSSKETLAFTAFYTDLYYQTPGGLTQVQLDTNPRLARPKAGSIPGAVTQHSSVRNKTAFGAVTLTSNFGSHFSNTTSFVLDHTSFTNPFITNYEERSEWNYNARTSFAYAYKAGNFALHAFAGGEMGYNVASVNDYGNRAGVKDTVQFKDLTHLSQYFVFAQVNINAGRRWVFQLGASNNTTHYWFNRLTDHSKQYPQQRNAGPLVTPRFSALFQVSKTTSVYASASEGFSTPTLAEVRPSDGNYYPYLQPEYGWNYEAGIKGMAIKGALEFNASAYYLKLKQAIVSRTDSTGAQYFVNSGGAIEKGIEVWFKAHLVHNTNHFVTSLDVWNSLSYQPYHFATYISGTNNYTGNRLTGVPRTINVSGIDLSLVKKWYAGVILNNTSSLPVDDANSAFAKAYHLLQIKLGKYFDAGACKLNAYLGIDNVLNEVYSLGNDINAVGKRYFNPAPARNFFIGVRAAF
ncbi:MAG TPA: TonB-dependent receptor [Chitinophagaceae bacterium]|nr:TonB-dependent receptor [Chitinophagaceae bacterium]